MDLLAKAIEVARNNPDARVAFVVLDYMCVKRLFETLIQEEDFLIKHNHSSIEFSNGARIQVLYGESIEQAICGAQFSHAFIDMLCLHTDKIYVAVRNRLRYTKNQKDVGMYDRYGRYLYWDEND